jgi:hypothetical protein
MKPPPIVAGIPREGDISAARERRIRWRLAEPALAELERGATVLDASRAASVSVASLSRWRSQDPLLAGQWRRALQAGRAVRAGAPRPPVSYVCPGCRGALLVRTGKGFRFWVCRRCSWKSWRPPAPVSVRCRACGGRTL